MPLQIPDQDYEKILRIVGLRFSGASVKELLENPGIDFPKRTLQRRLDQLVSDGRVEPMGQGRSRRYRVTPCDPEPSGLVLREEPNPTARSEWLSTEGREIRDIISLPLSERKPVGYRGEFLAAYQPNVTFYLPESLRRDLELIGGVGLGDLPAGTHLRQVMDRLMIDLSWNSSRLEGNTYSLLETQRLLAFGESADGKASHEAQMILNHKAAIEMLADDADQIDFNCYTICNLHALLADGLLQDPKAIGRVRSLAVGISGTVFHPLAVPQLVEEKFEIILQKSRSIRNPLEQAFFAMVHLPYLQPFEDVNKRVSRLAANIPLIRQNLCPLSFVDVDLKDYVGGLLGIYELNRVEYLRDVFARAYRSSCDRYAAVRQSLGEPDPLRVRYRERIKELVNGVVRARMDKRAAAKWIAAEAGESAPPADRAKLIELVETELSFLHVGSIARFRLKPSEFEIWHADWK